MSKPHAHESAAKPSASASQWAPPSGSGWFESGGERSHRLWIAVISLLAYLTAAVIASDFLGQYPSSDFTGGYHPSAIALREGRGYLDAQGKFLTAFPPGYSLFILPWVTEDPHQSAQHLRHVSGVLAVLWVLMLAWLAKRLLPRLAVWLVLVPAVFWPPMLAIGNPSLSEMFYTVLVTATVCVLVVLAESAEGRGWLMAAAAGTLIGLATLTRTLGLSVFGAALLAVATGFHAWRRVRRIAAAIIITIAFCAVLAPWVSVFHENTGHWGITQVTPRKSALLSPLGRKRLSATTLVQSWYRTAAGTYDAFLVPLQLPWAAVFVLCSFRALRRWRSVPEPLIVMHGFVGAAWVAGIASYPLLRYLAPTFPLVVLVTAWHALDAWGQPASLATDD
jgi:hypothetical protein